MMTEIDVVRDVSRKLESAGIPFMLTGSMAMNYYAEPRMTRDIDIVIAVAPDQVPHCVAVFSPDYYISLDAVQDAVARGSVFNLIHNESVIKVDCIVRKHTPYRRVEFERRRRIAILDFETWIVSVEDLIISKLAWAQPSRSELQLRDVRNLLATAHDGGYLNQWAKELGLDALLQECRRE